MWVCARTAGREYPLQPRATTEGKRALVSSLLKSLSLVINLAHNDPSLVEKLGDWKDYAWVAIANRACVVAEPCSAPRQRWDWHRDQFVDFTWAYDEKPRTVLITLTLTDRDPSDADFVCVTAVFLDIAQTPVLSFHQNWQIGPGQALSRRYALPAGGKWPSIATVALGSKQCRDGAHQDDDVFIRTIAKLHQAPASVRR